jgi:hypothetical protein
MKNQESFIHCYDCGYLFNPELSWICPMTDKHWTAERVQARLEAWREDGGMNHYWIKKTV